MDGIIKMEILIDEIREDGLTINFENPAKNFPVLFELVATGECKFAEPIKTALTAQRIGDMVKIEGDIDTSVDLSCSRCLQPFETPLKSHFTLTFMRRTADTNDTVPQEVELNAEDMGIVWFQGEKINLTNTIQEQVLMEFPLKALCTQDCQGLCTQCGADLNEDPCDCGRRSSSGKFDVLKTLKLEK
jgi:DUF177 domain-containing protein